MRYNNYHKHDHSGNPWRVDSMAKEEDYFKRAIELEHNTVFTTNHGIQGDTFTWKNLNQQYNLKVIHGVEAYYVKDFEGVNEEGKKERGRHIVIIAKNNDGFLQLNDMVSTSFEDGFYYMPRIDESLLFGLNPNNFIVTSACVAGIWNKPELLLSLQRYFKDNFFLEVQAHNLDIQKEVNYAMLKFSEETGIKLIHANDSHYIYAEDDNFRNIFLRGNDIDYKSDNESGMILDYPDSDTIFMRYKKQGILSQSQVQEALENTLAFDDCEAITLIDDKIKLPQIFDDPTTELRNVINERWKSERIDLDQSKIKEYLNDIREEEKTVEDTHMEPYFLIDYYIAKRAQEVYKGRLTNTGRGSAPSFYLTKLLGLTDIDRIESPITLYPSRFMSVERILGSRSLPDIDLNTTDRQPFIKATEDLLGKENCAWMISWKPLQDSSAFRTYCKGIGMNAKDYDNVAQHLDDFREDKKWKKIIEESQKLVGVTRSISESPCSMLLYYKPVRKEIGLVRTKSGKICCLLDGYNCDKWKYLKNDYLTVTVWAIIKDVCEKAGIKIPTIKEFDNLLDDQTYEIYKKGLTCTINQADSNFATSLVTRYQPRSVAEMAAFVAIIRPGCASLLQDFIDRKPYTTGVSELDELLVEGNHRLIYQELIMKYLMWLGIPETGTYDIIKKIAKKKFKEAELTELKKKLKDGWIKRVGTEDGFIETWTVVEQASRYSFNASHSLSYAYDSLYGAYLKSHYPLEYYTVALNYYSDDAERTFRLTDELKEFGIKLNGIKFRYSRSDYSEAKEENSIYKGIASIKEMNGQVAEDLYELRNNQYEDFVDLFHYIKKNKIAKKNQIQILTELDYFSEFGDVNYLLKVQEIYNQFIDKIQISKSILKQYGIDEDIVRPLCKKETAKLFQKVDMLKFIKIACKNIKEKHLYQKTTLQQMIKSQLDRLGYIDIIDDKYVKMVAILNVDTKYAPRIQAQSLRNGNVFDCKIQRRIFNMNKIEKGDVIRITGQKWEPKKRKNEKDEWEQVPGTKELWLTKYKKVENI